jgi:hypothetical protein
MNICSHNTIITIYQVLSTVFERFTHNYTIHALSELKMGGGRRNETPLLEITPKENQNFSHTY